MQSDLCSVVELYPSREVRSATIIEDTHSIFAARTSKVMRVGEPPRCDACYDNLDMAISERTWRHFHQRARFTSHNIKGRYFVARGGINSLGTLSLAPNLWFCSKGSMRRSPSCPLIGSLFNLLSACEMDIWESFWNCTNLDTLCDEPIYLIQ